VTQQAEFLNTLDGQPAQACKTEHGEFRGQFAVDLLIASALIAALWPLIVLRAGWALLTHGRLVEKRQGENDAAVVAFPRFAGKLPGADLATLFPIVAGRMTFVEPPSNPARQGVFSTSKTRLALGVDYLESEKGESDKCSWGIKNYLAVFAKAVLAMIVSPVRRVESDGDFYLFGIPILNATMTGVLDKVQDNLNAGRQISVGFVNADCMNKSFSNERYHRTLVEFDCIYPDGIGVRIAAQMFGNGVLDNINGTDLFPLLCERLAGTSNGIFLLGARDGIAKAAAKNMADRYPGLTVSGCHHGYFTAEEEESVIEKINSSGASVLMVALGAPQQELWIARNRDRLNARILMGVGGLFDFYSGRIERAPVWLRETGLEWVWRLLQEPGRMWRRYVIGNPLFLCRAWLQKRRNGSVTRSMGMTPAEEADVIEHFGKLDQAVSIRPRILTLQQVYWDCVKAGGAALKRLLDFGAGSILLILLSPVFAVVILLIRVESPGPAFYSQMRVGYRGRQFKLWKFRSMYVDAEARRAELETANEMKGGVLFKMKKDPRITRVGRFIRKASVDEMPQLWNVIKGDMSLVGPRPALESEVELYSIEERVRLMAKPGLTCFWQVSGRSDIPFPKQVLLDEDYLYRQSLFTDIKLLFQTIPAVLRGKGAY
jgi:exopolysaccharide biosynthesis WecB/TagA/CpsF family protein